MTKRSFALAAALLFAGTAAFAVTTQEVVDQYTAQNYTRIEVRNGLTQMKVEAIKGSEKLEVIIDKATGAILKSETGTVGIFDNTADGVSVRDRNRDFVRVSSDDDSTDDDDDEDEDGSRRGRGSSDDDSSGSDDDGERSGGSDDGSDHDAGDDHGGDRSGSDDSGSDDRGSDDSGSDDSGSDDNGGSGSSDD